MGSFKYWNNIVLKTVLDTMYYIKLSVSDATPKLYSMTARSCDFVMSCDCKWLCYFPGPSFKWHAILKSNSNMKHKDTSCNQILSTVKGGNNQHNPYCFLKIRLLLLLIKVSLCSRWRPPQRKTMEQNGEINRSREVWPQWIKLPHSSCICGSENIVGEKEERL